MTTNTKVRAASSTRVVVESKSCLVVLSARGCRTVRVPVTTADQASAVWARFRDINGISSSDLKRDSGNILAPDGELIAQVSYNGKVWSADGQTLLQDTETE